jgi:hypothetical protein
MFPVLFAGFLIAILVIDGIFLPRSSRRMLRLLAVLFAGAALVAIFQEPLFFLASRLGVGRPVDLVMYVVVVILVRELLLSRARFVQLESQVTTLARAEALRSARAQGGPEEGAPPPDAP